MRPKYEVENNGVYAKLLNLGTNSINPSGGEHKFTSRENEVIYNFFDKKMNNSVTREVIDQFRNKKELTNTIPLNLTSETDGPLRVGVYAQKGKFALIMSNVFETGDSYKKSIELFKQLIGIKPKKNI